jgi:hypothetical protein
MDTRKKAEIKKAYKETPSRRGVFTIRCSATGQTWVDSARNVDTIKNRVWFTLGMGSSPNRQLQQAWNESGADTIEYEIVEVFPDDISDFALEDLLKERKQHWLKELAAEPYQ